MRRCEREVTDRARQLEILRSARILRIAYVDEGGLTIVPVTFVPLPSGGRLELAFHGSPEGRKAAAFAGGAQVVFEAEGPRVPSLDNGRPCGNGWFYSSVVGSGRVVPVDGAAEKARCLSALVQAHNPDCPPVTEGMASFTAVWKIAVEELSAKEKAAG